jgi:hypothetical protein
MPFWGWKRNPVNATILKIDDEDDIPLKLDTRDVLERTHKVTRVKKYVKGVLEDCPGEDSIKIGEFQLENGHVKDFHKRKSLEAQWLQSIQQEYIENWEKTAKQFGLPEDLCYNTTFDGKAKKKREMPETCSTKQSPKGERNKVRKQVIQNKNAMTVQRTQKQPLVQLTWNKLTSKGCLKNTVTIENHWRKKQQLVRRNKPNRLTKIRSGLEGNT